MRIDVDGNIGVHTADPGTALEIESPNPGPLAIFNSTSGSWVTLQFERDGTPKASTAISPLDTFGGDAFVVGSNDGTWSDPLVIENGAPTGALYVQAGGNVGIGTTEPGVALEVSSSEAPIAKLNGDGENYVTIDFYRQDAARASCGVSPPGEYGGNAFFCGTNDGTWNDALIIENGAPTGTLYADADGNVGVGTMEPKSSLQVEGDYVQFPTISGGPPSDGDCDEAAEAGRMVVRTDGSTNLYVCTGVTGWVGK